MDILLFPWAVAIKHIAYITLTLNTSSASPKTGFVFLPEKKVLEQTLFTMPVIPKGQILHVLLFTAHSDLCVTS